VQLSGVQARCANQVTHLPSEMKTISMGGVSKKVIGLVLSIRIMEEASTAQLQYSQQVRANGYSCITASRLEIVKVQLPYSHQVV
jgi:hypothetical protein